MKGFTKLFCYTFLIAAFLLVGLCSPVASGLLDGAVWFEREVGEGVIWRYYQFDNLFGAKQSVSYMEVDLSNPNIDLKIRYRNSWIGPAPPLDSPNFPRAFTSVFASEVPGARAAINGTYFNTASFESANPTRPWGGGTTYLKVDGNIIHRFDGTNVNLFPMALLYNSRNDLTLARRPSGGWAGVQSSWANMMISGPVLLENGVVERYDSGNDHANLRHPRSAVGLTPSNKMILLAVAGRTAEAAGMSCTELANVLLALGCTDAINLDGGGSSTLWAAGEPFSGVVNYPSDNAAYDHLGERRCANALVVVANPPTPAAWDGRITNLTHNPLTRSNQILIVTATYTNIGTQPWTAANVKVVPSRPFGRTSSFIPAGQENTFYTITPSTVASGQTATITLNLVAPVVTNDTLLTESFALQHVTLGYFGPPDNKLRVRATVRPPLDGLTPPLMIIQGTPTGSNNQWYFEGPAGWANSSVSFTAAGVNNSGTQRLCFASVTGRFARFRPIFDVAGTYRVDVAFPSSTNNITVRYEVSHLNGVSHFTINQNPSGGSPNTWITLGEFDFGTESTSGGTMGVHWVEVGNPTTTGNRFYSGAVRFDYVPPSNVIEWQSY